MAKKESKQPAKQPADATISKATIARQRMELINLLRSGFAGLSDSGKIVDRRDSKVVKAFAEEPLLAIPKPRKL